MKNMLNYLDEDKCNIQIAFVSLCKWEKKAYIAEFEKKWAGNMKTSEKRTRENLDFISIKRVKLRIN